MGQEERLQADFDAKESEYLDALYAQPRDENKCLSIARELLELTLGTDLERRQRQVVARHLRRI